MTLRRVSAGVVDKCQFAVTLKCSSLTGNLEQGKISVALKLKDAGTGEPGQRHYLKEGGKMSQYIKLPKWYGWWGKDYYKIPPSIIWWRGGRP